MKNKTCGECENYDHHHLLCFIGGDVKPTERAKDCFVSSNPTNGDRIRQMSNAELAELIVPKVMFCDGCPVKCEEKDIPQHRENPLGADVAEDVCKKRVEEWLNAPAGKDTNVPATFPAEEALTADVERRKVEKMSNRIDRYCKSCGNVPVADAGYYAGSQFFQCETCGRRGMSDIFPKATVFHQLTASPEVLALCLVYAYWFPDSAKPVFKSTVQVGVWETSYEAIAATVARLKEVCDA